jgi:pyridoxal phosphate enzyme (YggS family)
MSLSDAQIEARLRDNLAAVHERIAAAVARSGRGQEKGVMLVGVTKYVEPPLARLLVMAGLKHLGESRPQELWRKSKALVDLNLHHNLTWHLIGHLQRNKVKRTLKAAGWIHSGDSLALLQTIDRESGPVIHDVLVEINISGEPAKHGFRPDEIESLLPEINKLQNIHIRGLMTMAGLEGGPDRARRDFAALRELRDRLKPSCPPWIDLTELSMGMSGDYEVAIEEGATIVRVGSALFEGIVEEH